MLFVSSKLSLISPFEYLKYAYTILRLQHKIYFKDIVYQGSTEQDAIASSLITTVKKIINGLSFKHQFETVMPTSRVAVSISIHISTTNSVKYSRGADSSYEQFYCGLGTPLNFVCGIQTPHCYWTIHATGQFSFSSNHGSTFYAQLNRLIVD